MTNRDVDAARAYHDATKHSYASVYGQRHQLDWDVMPRPFKVYPDLPALPLPRDFTTSTRPVLAALADPGAAAAPGPALDRTALARLLFFSAGILRKRTHAGGETYFRAAACTGALYHIDLYLVSGPLADLEAGVHHFGPHDFALRRLRAGDHRAAVVAATAGEPAVAAAPALLVLTTTFWRNAWKYRARAYRHAFWDAGTLLANLLALAAACELPARVVLGFVDEALDALLDLDVAREVTIAVVPLGGGGAPPPPAPSAPALGLATLPPSEREVDHPEIRRAHLASSLATAAEVAAWRGAPPERPVAASAGPRVALAPLPDGAVREPIEAVVLRRGSTRQFAAASIGLDQLSTILWCATRGVPSDVGDTRLTAVYVVAHAIGGLAPGAYAYDPQAGALECLRAGTFRRDAGQLALGQALAADAAVDVFWLADLAPALARFGNRGYRAAQLEAAIEGGKTYLGAYAFRLGATGLTFFDDDVTAFFSPHAAGKSVMFLMAVGRPGRG
jgi:SagB-type dehydrogenase family enzyme